MTAVDGPDPATARRPRRWNARVRGPRDRTWAFLLPAYGAILAVVGIPIGYSFWLSFHQWKLTTFRQGVPFVGLDNYIQAISDHGFWHSLQVTVGCWWWR